MALVQLYLSVFYPQDVDQAEKLVRENPGDEKDQLFKKLSTNFLAINPMKHRQSSKSQSIDYKKLLLAFYNEHDADKAIEVDDILSKCKGKEAVLFSVYAQQYKRPNALNSVFEDRLRAMDLNDHLGLLILYLSVFHPAKMSSAKPLLSQFQGKEAKLFSNLAEKFRACDALEVCSRLGKNLLESIEENESDEEKTEPEKVQTVLCDSRYSSPKKSARVGRKGIPPSPAVTP